MGGQSGFRTPEPAIGPFTGSHRRRQHMKRHLTLILGLLLAGPAVLAAQSGFGIKGGASFGDVSNKGVLPGDLGGRTGFAVGLSLASRGGLVGLGVEGLYAQRG